VSRLDRYDALFVVTAFSIQVILLCYFALRKWRFDAAMRIGWEVYALAIPAAIISVVLLFAGRPWYLWLAGFLFAAWATFGYVVDIARPVAWRSPILWSAFIPYVLLYLSTMMFYWWPMATLHKPLWYVYAVLFVISTVLNVSSHS